MTDLPADPQQIDPAMMQIEDRITGGGRTTDYATKPPPSMDALDVASKSPTQTVPELIGEEYVPPRRAIFPPPDATVPPSHRFIDLSIDFSFNRRLFDLGHDRSP